MLRNIKFEVNCQANNYRFFNFINRQDDFLCLLIFYFIITYLIFRKEFKKLLKHKNIKK